MTTNLSLPDVPRSTMFTKDGRMDLVWQEFFRDLFRRVGGNSAYSNAEIVEIIGYSGLTPLRLVRTTSDSKFSVVDDLTDWVKTESVNKITITDLGDGTLRLSLPASIELSGATGNRLLATDSNQRTISVDLSSWLSGTADKVTITDNFDGTVTATLPDSIELSGATASKLLATDADKKTESVANLGSWVGGTANKVSVADDGDGSVTLSIPDGAVINFGNSGVSIQDTDASHVISVVAGSNLTADRDLTITTGDADRTVTLSGNPTLADWFDQAVKTTSSPTFDDLTLTGSASLDDGEKIFIGTGNSSSVSFDGTDLWINPALVGTGSVKIGDGTNYTEIQDDGTILLHGTARKKREITVQSLTSGKGAAAPTEYLRPVGASGGVKSVVLQFSKVVQNDVYFPVHLALNADTSVNVQFHLMWIPGASWTSGNYLWKLEYLVKTETGSSTSGTPTTISMDVTPANATDFIETVFTDTISVTEDSTIICHFYRDVASDNADDVGSIRFFEVEYTVNKIGE